MHRADTTAMPSRPLRPEAARHSPDAHREGANINAQGGNYGNALQAAAAEACYGIVQMLIEKGANINAQGGYYGNALQAAAARGCHGIVQMLIEKEPISMRRMDTTAVLSRSLHQGGHPRDSTEAHRKGS